MAIKWGTGKWYDWPAGGIFDNTPAEKDPYGQLTPEQKAMMGNLSGVITSGYNTPSSYGGNYTADLTPEEQTSIDRQGRLAAMGESWASSFQPGQINPETDANELRKYNEQFYGNGINPGAKALAEEQFAGSGGYWGDARAKGVMDTYGQTVTSPYQNWRSNALQNSYQNALNYGSSMTSINQTTANMQAVPRQIKQYGLDKQYSEFVRGQEEKQRYITSALSFLGLGTGTYIPSQASSFEQMLPEIIKTAGTIAATA